MNETTPHTANMSAPSEVELPTFASLKRAYQKQLRRKPGTLLKLEINRTCLLDIEEARVLADQKATPNDRVRAVHVARIQRLRLMGMIEAGRPPEHQPTYSELMNEHGDAL